MTRFSASTDGSTAAVTAPTTSPTGAAAREFSGLITLNELGAFIWEPLNEAADAQDLAKMIAAEYEVDPATARADAQEFLDLLISRHMAEL